MLNDNITTVILIVVIRKVIVTLTSWEIVTKQSENSEHCQIPPKTFIIVASLIYRLLLFLHRF